MPSFVSMKGLLCCLFLVSAFADYDVYWKRSVTVSDDDLKGRTTAMAVVNNLLYTGFSYTSYKYQAQQGQASANGVIGAAGAGANGPPVAYLSYFDVDAQLGGGGNAFTADVSGAASFIGAAWLALVEVGADGAHLGGIRLKNLDWETADTSVTGTLKTGKLVGTTTAHPDLKITLVFATASEAGELTNGAIISPKSVQVTVNILNFPFEDTTGTSELRLISAVGLASVTVAGEIKADRNDAFRRLQAGSKDKAVFYDVATHAYIDKDENKHAVTITSEGTASTDGFDGAYWLSQLNTLKLANVNIQTDFKIINASLPHSNNITLDPTIGVGTPANDMNAASGLAPTPLMTLAVIFLALAKFL